MATTPAAGPRVAIVVSHPIQHWVPQYASYAQRADWQTRIFFASTAGLEPYHDENFGRTVQWAGMALDFDHEFLNDGAAVPSSPGLDAPDLDARLAAYAPDVVVVYGYIQKVQRRALRWATANKVPVLMTADSEHRHARPLHRRLAKRLALPRLYRQFDGFLTFGDANEDYHVSFGAPAERLFRSPYPIDARAYDAAFARRDALRADVFARYDVPADTATCSVVGKLVPWKRQVDLVRAVARLPRTGRPVTAFVLGSGTEMDACVDAARGIEHHRVVFAGFVQPDELPAFYAASDVYVHPAQKEAHSVAISEAIYMGCPVVISDRCGSYGPTDDVQAGRNGFVFPCGDVDALAGHIARVVADDALRTRFSGASREHALRAQALSHGAGMQAALTGLGLL